MSSRIPNRVDPRRMSEQRREISGEMAICELHRLIPMLAATEGKVGFRLLFQRDGRKRPIVMGNVQAELVLICQRCLGPVSLKVDRDFGLAVVTGLDEAANLPEEFEPLLMENDGNESESVSIVQIIEDELLLSVPSVPRHDSDCGVAASRYSTGAGSTALEHSSPFEALAALRADTEKD